MGFFFFQIEKSNSELQLTFALNPNVSTTSCVNFCCSLLIVSSLLPKKKKLEKTGKGRVAQLLNEGSMACHENYLHIKPIVSPLEC